MATQGFTTTQEQLFNDYYPTIPKLAHRHATRYRGFVEPDDLVQEMSMWCLTNGDKLEEWLTPDEDGKTKHRVLAKALFRHADKYCRREKAKASKFLPSDEFFYTPELIVKLLQAWWNGDGFLEPDGEAARKGSSDPAEGNNFPAFLHDVTQAFCTLTGDMRLVLEEVYRHEIPVTQLATETGLSRHQINRRVNRALNMMVERLGGENPYREPKEDESEDG